MSPSLAGLSHLSLSVTDLGAAVRFWTGVMGFEVVMDEPQFRLVLHRDTRVAIGLSDHQREVAGQFDERRVGLDHVAFAVRDIDDLSRWEHRLTELGVPHSTVVESDAGHHLNLRAPDGVAVELFVVKPELFALLGVSDAASAVARSGRT